MATASLLALEPSDDDIVGLAFDEVRIAAAGQPTVLIHLLDILSIVGDSLDEGKRPKAMAALRRQADLVLESAAVAELPGADRERVRQAHADRFGARG